MRDYPQDQQDQQDRPAGRPVPPPAGPPRLTAGASGHSMFPDLDAAYERLLDVQARLRHEVATVATSRRRLQLQISQILSEADQNSGASVTREAGMADPAMQELGGSGRGLAELRGRLSAVEADEEHAGSASQRLRVTVDAFRNASKSAEAAYLTAEQTAQATLAEVTSVTAAYRE